MRRRVRQSGWFALAAAVLIVAACNKDPGTAGGSEDGGVVDTAGEVDGSGSDTEPAGDGGDTAATDGEVDTAPVDGSSDTVAEDTSGDDTSVADTSGADTTADGTGQDGGPDGVSDGGADTDAGTKRWRVCSKSSDCVLKKNDCCGWCGAPMLSDLDAVNRNRTMQHFNDVCANPGMPCPSCPQQPIPGSFEAHCAASTCQKIDLAPYQSCTNNSDCRIRTLDCCEDCTSDTSREGLVAIAKSKSQQVKSALCPTPRPGCARCLINYPSNLKAVCNTNGRCVLQ